MIRPSAELDRFERMYARARGRTATYKQSLAIFEALWAEAIALHPDFPTRDWKSDLAPDLAIARAINGLPPDA